jgi:4-amino-4-deoxy-L-arabinose transferase-like glycosyltransferase
MLTQPGKENAGLTARKSFLIALAVSLLLSLAPVFSHSLWTPDEPTGAGIGRAMADSGDWIVPRLNGKPFLEKPPLYWWTLAGSLRLLGMSDVAARAPSALFAVLTLLAVWAAGVRLGRPREGLLGVCVLATLVLFVQNATRVTVDPALMFFVALAHLGFVLWIEARSPGERRGAVALLALAVPLAFLCKGIVAVGLGAGPPVLYLLATRRARAVRELLPLAAVAIPAFALLVVPWAMALWREAGWEGVRVCLISNTVGRMVQTQETHVFGHSEPFWFYLAIAPPLLLPWTLALPAMLRSGRCRWGQPGSEGHRLLIATAGLGLLLLTVPATKREVYLLPLLPAFVVCAAGWLDRVGKPGEMDSRDRRALLALGIFAAALPLLLGAATLWLAWAPRLPKGAVPVRNSVPAAALAGFGIAALIVGGALAAGLIRRWRPGPSVRWAVLALILVTLGLETGAEALIDPVKRSDDLTAAIAANFPGRGPVPAYLPRVVSNEAISGSSTSSWAGSPRGWPRRRRSRRGSRAIPARQFWSAWSNSGAFPQTCAGVSASSTTSAAGRRRPSGSRWRVRHKICKRIDEYVPLRTCRGSGARPPERRSHDGEGNQAAGPGAGDRGHRAVLQPRLRYVDHQQPVYLSDLDLDDGQPVHGHDDQLGRSPG